MLCVFTSLDLFDNQLDKELVSLIDKYVNKKKTQKNKG